ncbi:MAG: hypothetical protein ACAH20_06445 [Methylobacteriaceae bacterium]
MTDEIERLGLLAGLMEVAIGRLFETAEGGAEAKRLFVEDVRRLLADTRAVQTQSPAIQTYEALLRRLGATGAEDGPLGVVPTPEQGLPPAGAGV